MDHTIALIRKSHDGDEKARVQLVEENVGLVWCVVRRFYGRGVEPEDLFQIGAIGFLKAISNFSEGFGVKFTTYAVPMICGEVMRFLRDDGSVKVSRTLKALAVKIASFTEEYRARTGESPAVDVLAEEFKVEAQEIVYAIGSSKPRALFNVSFHWASDI